MAAEVPVNFQSDRTILNTNLVTSRLCDILQQDVLSDIETGPCTPRGSRVKTHRLQTTSSSWNVKILEYFL